MEECTWEVDQPQKQKMRVKRVNITLIYNSDSVPTKFPYCSNYCFFLKVNVCHDKIIHFFQ